MWLYLKWMDERLTEINDEWVDVQYYGKYIKESMSVPFKRSLTAKETPKVKEIDLPLLFAHL